MGFQWNFIKKLDRLRTLSRPFYYRIFFFAGELSITQKRGVITCMPTGNKSREYLKNWRSISLLTTDYKIITGVMANIMRSVLTYIISDDQKGFF